MNTRTTSSQGRLRRASLGAACVVFGAAMALGACSVTETTDDDGNPKYELDSKVSLPEINAPTGDNSGSSSGGDSGGNGSGDPAPPPAPDGGSNNAPSSASSNATDDGADPLALAVIVIGLIAVIALFVASSGSGDHKAAEDARRRSARRQLNGTLQNARWASSQATTALTIADESQLQASWSQARSYMPDIEASAASLASSESDSDLASAVGAMGQGVAALRGAMDNYVTTRATHGIEDPAARTAEQAVRQATATLDRGMQHVSDLAVAAGT